AIAPAPADPWAPSAMPCWHSRARSSRRRRPARCSTWPPTSREPSGAREIGRLGAGRPDRSKGAKDKSSRCVVMRGFLVRQEALIEWVTTWEKGRGAVRVSEGKISGAVLSSASFAAPDAADHASVTFGRTGDERSLESCDAGSVDVGGDGLPDLVCRFSTLVTAFRTGDTEGVLKGRTLDGLPVVGRTSVNVVPAQGAVATCAGCSSQLSRA